MFGEAARPVFVASRVGVGYGLLSGAADGASHEMMKTEGEHKLTEQARTWRGLLLGLVPVLSFIAPSAEAALIGQTLEVNYYYPDLSSTYAEASFSPQSFIVAAGIETIGTVEGVTNLLTDFDDNQLIITFDTVLQAPSWNTAAFNGLVFALRSGNNLQFASLLINDQTTVTGFNDSRTSFTGQTLWLNWNGLSYLDGQKIVLDLGFNNAPMPEPSTLALTLGGMVGVALVGRRLRSQGRRPARSVGLNSVSGAS
jgi:hypothetical protein